ncbi:MAG: YkgJ family cysteine cluster protein [Candidatus Heimdallarchaeota archaeon]|nr:YkgJ family cysteine cluster protein [Candidatus Heimdallarchaeota archaeon]
MNRQAFYVQLFGQFRKKMDISGTIIATVNEHGEIDVVRHIYFECTSCTECCRLNNIPVTEPDIRLMQDHGIEIDQMLEELSPVLIANKNLEKNGFIKAYILRKKPFVNECVFVDEKGLCKVHKFKPLTCQLYPFSVKKDENKLCVIVHPKNICEFIELDVEESRSNTIEITEELLTALFGKKQT